MIMRAKVSVAEFGFTGTMQDAWQGPDGLLRAGTPTAAACSSAAAIRTRGSMH
jgi:hypothetical protein